jgi:hypothetical protein
LRQEEIVESETMYKRVASDHIVPDRDLVIRILPGATSPVAEISDPKNASASEPMPVPQALKVVADEMALEPYYLEVVVVDDENLWQDEWGKLIEHPTRVTSKAAMSL